MIKKLKPISTKRAKQLKSYKVICDELDLVKPCICWFCGKDIKEQPDHHHSMGRDGDFLLAKEHLVHAHRNCHTEYHSLHLFQLLKTSWYIGWMQRICGEIKEKELNKFIKNNLNPKEYGI